jgi:ABC-2 type transport system permease protein
MRDLPDAAMAAPPEPRQYPGLNWIGMQALYAKEIRRFMKVGMQTVGAPVLTSLLYMLVFAVATAGARPPVHDVPYVAFVAPGLIMMTVMNNAFANSSSSLLQLKMQGLIQDILTPPLSPVELTVGFTLGAVTRGLLVGMVTWICVEPFARLGLPHPLAAAYFLLAACMIMALMGLLGGLWATKFDHMATITNFIVMPMTFLSGTFYSVERLPEPFRTASRFNPFFYLIDGLRYGLIGHSEQPTGPGALYVGALAVVLAAVVWRLFTTGYRLKS